MTLLTLFLGYLVLGAIVSAVSGRFVFMGWLHQVFIVCDQLVNVFATPFHRGAWADETLSARAYRAYAGNRAWGLALMPVVDLLFFWQGPRHCERAYNAEVKRLQAPPEAR